MTPFGERLRALRQDRGIQQKDMAKALGVSAAYLSALEHGKRGRPPFALVESAIGYLNIIWDEADELRRLAGNSNPRNRIDTSALSARATAFANRLEKTIGLLDSKALGELDNALEENLRRLRAPGARR
jgi:transcriptional regulator with XRE-family HTH domain